jgi:hypothetical protein
VRLVDYSDWTQIADYSDCTQITDYSDCAEPICRIEIISGILSIAEKQIRALSSRQYRNAIGCNGSFILRHSVGHMPNNSEVDVPLVYAGYYFVETLMRYKKLNNL